MDEAEKYQQRLQAIKEKRQIQEEEEKVRRGVEEESIKLAQHQRKTLREQWLMDPPAVTSSSPEDPELQSSISAFYTTEQTAEEPQILERQMKKEEVEKLENKHEEPPQIRENTPLILAADNREMPTQACLEEEKRNVKVLDVKLHRHLVSSAPQDDTEEKDKALTNKQEVDQLTVDAFNEPSLDDEEWEIVNCSPEERMDMVLTSVLTQDQSDLCLDNKCERAVLEVEHIFIMDEEDDLEVSAPEVMSLVVTKRKSYEGALQTHVATSAALQELGYVPGAISEEPSVFPVDTTWAQIEILEENTKKQVRQCISAGTNVKAERKEASDLKDEVRQHIPRKIYVQHNYESEIQVLTLPSGTLNRAETVTSSRRKTCQCCIIM